MFLRVVRIKKGSQAYKYLKLVKSIRKKGRVIQKVVVNFGNINGNVALIGLLSYAPVLYI